MMRYYNTPGLEYIGLDFYCDIANQIVKARKEKGFTQSTLAKISGIKEQRLSLIENVKIRININDVRKIADALDVTIDWLIEAELDAFGKECLYLVWPISMPDFRLYIRSTSARRAFLNYDKVFKQARVKYNSRERFYVKLVGVPCTKEELQSRFPERTSEDLPIEPDNPEVI